MTKEQRLQIVKLKNEGRSLREISNELKISIGSIRNVISSDKCYCKSCGAELKMTEGKKKKQYCNDKCRMTYWALHQQEINKKAYYKCKCNSCGAEFLSYGNKKRSFCSRDCYIKGANKKAGGSDEE